MIDDAAAIVIVQAEALPLCFQPPFSLCFYHISSSFIDLFSACTRYTMSLTKLGVFANLALAASAVLIPSTMTAEDLGDDHAFETLAINPPQRSVALQCPGCGVFTTSKEDLFDWRADGGNAFVGSHHIHYSLVY